MPDKSHSVDNGIGILVTLIDAYWNKVFNQSNSCGYCSRYCIWYSDCQRKKYNMYSIFEDCRNV